MKIDQWLNSPWFVRILALFLALMLWANVNMETGKNPAPVGSLPQISRETEALSNVPLNVYYNQDKYVISGLPQSVNVYVEGTSSVIRAMKAQGGYEVFVDLQHLTPGTHKVRVEHRGFSDKLTVKIDPALLDVTIKEKVEQIMSVDIQIVNKDKLPEGYIAEEPISVPKSVAVRGSLEDVQKIAFVEGYVDVAGAKDTVEVDVPLKVFDHNGEELKLEIVPAVVEVKVPISPPNKKVPYKINRKGNLPKGLSIQSFEVTPSEITVYGTKENLEKIKMIEDIDIDLSKIDEDQTIEVKVPVPAGAIKVNPEVLTIRVDVEPEESKTISNVPIKINGVSNTQGVSFITPENGHVNLTIYGAKKVIEQIGPEDFDVRLNAGGLSKGEYEIDINVVSGPQDIRWEIRPSKAQIEILND
ncbi:CdaR family protein [Calidifontibacillus erzurumensis]|uniref:YbbR-like domain-containing protein n=1 Tax=Calidifontibacillus erzurumensis TaxID=2741433 RepID=A0A8J8GHM2_9BACI|nr:CdaR family protein [Calidifontibacillus erzurumensis]NSL53336.1 YbbR-like domain-containing protein [Calidifontibacillus erzurumensis]